MKLQGKGSTTTSLYCAHALCVGEHKKVFANAGALAQHAMHMHGASKPLREVFKKRKSYSVRFKFNAVAMLHLALLVVCISCGICPPPHTFKCPECKGPCTRRLNFQYQVADELGVHPSLLNKWKMSHGYDDDVPVELDKYKKLHPGVLVRFREQEDQV
jgi:hypothetical protein